MLVEEAVKASIQSAEVKASVGTATDAVGGQLRLQRFRTNIGTASPPPSPYASAAGNRVTYEYLAFAFEHYVSEELAGKGSPRRALRLLRLPARVSMHKVVPECEWRARRHQASLSHSAVHPG